MDTIILWNNNDMDNLVEHKVINRILLRKSTKYGIIGLKIRLSLPKKSNTYKLHNCMLKSLQFMHELQHFLIGIFIV